ncbi:hypothetical protein [Thermaerobacter litoralis]
MPKGAGTGAGTPASPKTPKIPTRWTSRARTGPAWRDRAQEPAAKTGAAWRWRQAFAVFVTASGTVAVVELARRAGAPPWLLVLAGAGTVAGGMRWLDRQWGRWRSREEHRHWLVETVLDEFRSRATAVTLAAGMLRRHPDGRPDPLAPEPPAGLPPGAGPTGSGASAGGDGLATRPGRVIPLPLAEAGGREAQVLVHLEAEAELLRVSALQLACWLRLQTRRVRPERERVDLAVIAERAARRLAPVALSRRVQLAVAGRPGPAAVVHGDRALLELLCTSLAAAALDRSLPGSRLILAVDGDGAAVRVRVEAPVPAASPQGTAAPRPAVWNPATNAAGVDRPVIGPAAPSAGPGSNGWPGRTGRTGTTAGTPVGNRWRRGASSPLALELVQAITALHGGRWRLEGGVQAGDRGGIATGGGWPWVVELPAANGPFGILRPFIARPLAPRRPALPASPVRPLRTPSGPRAAGVQGAHGSQDAHGSDGAHGSHGARSGRASSPGRPSSPVIPMERNRGNPHLLGPSKP